MQENYPPSYFDRLNSWIRNSITLKLISIGILILLLLIPLSMVQDLIRERKDTNDSAVDEVSSKWGGPQRIAGPCLVVPAKIRVTDKEKVFETTEYYYFLPEELSLNGELIPEKRHRSIYEVVVYRAQAQISGKFKTPDFSEWKSQDQTILWQDAYLSFGVSDLSGLRENVNVHWNDSVFHFEPGVGKEGIVESGLHAKVSLHGDTAYNFKFDLILNGSSTLQFAPLGRETKMSLNSSWPHPGFDGAFLPDSPRVDEKGFSANWKVIHLNRNYPQSWRGNNQRIEESYFGVNMIVPVDHYQKNTRSAKYGVLIIALTFLVYFFTEMIGKQRVHPFQFVLVGLAVCIFYTLLLAFSEHLGFNTAYLLAAVLVIGAISLYSRSVFKKMSMVYLLGGVLTLIYGFIFVIIQLQDFALLVGSLGLFLVLLIVMYLSQKIKWYKEDAS